MKIALLIFVIFWICIYSLIIFGYENQVVNVKINDLIPQKGDIDEWSPEGEAQFEVGQDLFLLINGGAAIYHEYGFKAVVFQSYLNMDGKSINLEIYEMDSQEAAYGIYTFKTGADGEPVQFGHDGWLSSYYLNFWKGRFLVTVIGLENDSTILNGMNRIAQAVDLKLKVISERPGITTYLPKENLQVNGITYLKGNLALFNQYKFDTMDIFGLQEGVIGKYAEYTIFLFQYKNHEESKRWYNIAKSNLKDNNDYKHFSDKIFQFETYDDQNNKLTIQHSQKWILIILGNNTINRENILKTLEKNLAQ